MERALRALALDISATRWLVAFSGGLDSTVLLHAAAAVFGAGRIVAAHVHHGLQAAADAWPAHCERQARALGVAFECVRLPAHPARGANLEGWAREQRYLALAALARSSGAEAILTAHHADDQVETVLMHLARGSGVDGLAGIAPVTTLAGASVRRPFLDLRRDELAAWARERSLGWIDDPTNADTDRTRNAIRRRVLPEFDAALPGFREAVLAALPAVRAARDAQHALAQCDLAAARTGQGVDRRVLAALAPQRRNLALRAWLREEGLRMPSEARLAEIGRQLVEARGAYGRVVHDGVELLRYRDQLHVRAAQALAPARDGVAGGRVELRWRGEASIALPSLGGELLVETVARGDVPCGAPGDVRGDAPRDAPGIAARWLREQVLVISPGGASSLRLRPHPGARRRTLKNLYQERGIPAWNRQRLPLVFASERLLYASGVGMDCEGDLPRDGRCVTLRWRPLPASFAAPHHV